MRAIAQIRRPLPATKQGEPNILDLLSEQAAMLFLEAKELETTMGELQHHQERGDTVPPVVTNRVGRLSVTVVRSDLFTYEVRAALVRPPFRWQPPDTVTHHLANIGLAHTLHSPDINPQHEIAFVTEQEGLIGQVSLFSLGVVEGHFYDCFAWRWPDRFPERAEKMGRIVRALARIVFR